MPPGLMRGDFGHALDSESVPEIASDQTERVDSQSEPQQWLDADRVSRVGRSTITDVGWGHGCARRIVAVVCLPTRRLHIAWWQQPIYLRHNGFDVTDAVYNARSSIRRVPEHHMVPAEVCDGQDPAGSTSCGRKIDITLPPPPAATGQTSST
jgi:hypothetical protein